MGRLANPFFACALAFFCLSCTKETEAVEKDQDTATDAVVFTATLQQPTKANLDNYKVIWNEGDRISVHDGNSWKVSDPLLLADISGVGTKASFRFTKDTPAIGSTYYAVYPASAAPVTAPSEDMISVILPEVQNITSGTIAKDALVQVCKGDDSNNLYFRNVTSLIEFKIPADGVSSVCFEAVEGDSFSLERRLPIAGGASVNVAAPATDIVGTGTRVVVNGDFIKDKNYFAVVYPAASVGKYRFTFTDSADGTRKAFKTGKSDSVDRFPLNGGWKFESFGELHWLGPLSNAEDLAKWVNSISYYKAEETVKIAADIDWGGAEWIPVDGNESTGFAGAIDGQGHSIYGILIKTNSSANGGFFSTLESDSPRLRVKDLKLGYVPGVEGNKVDATNKLILASPSAVCGNLAGICRNCEVRNVHSYMRTVLNYASVADVYLGGIAGKTLGECNFSDCSNNNTVACIKSGAASTYIGGIVGGSDGIASFSRCRNCAEVKRTQSGGGFVCIGGIVGTASGTEAGVFLSECSNDDKISCAGSAGTNPAMGGIIGRVACDGLVSDCSNLGSVVKSNNSSSEVRLGGIAGELTGSATIRNCTNGDATDETIGAVSDNAQSAAGPQRIGGIAGLQTGGSIDACLNYGKIFGASSSANAQELAGGIVGDHFAGEINSCESFGEVSLSSTNADSSAGGLIGLHSGNSACSTGEGCKVNAIISCGAPTGAGLVVGRYSNSAACVLGSEISLISVGGWSVCGSDVTQENYLDYVTGASSGFSASGVVFGKGSHNTIWVSWEDDASVGRRPFQAWSEGYLDIHFISTNRGECAFYILPDGTTIVVDAGEIHSTSELPQRPNSGFRVYKNYGNYIKHFLPATAGGYIDYAFLTHFHIDHMGEIHSSNPKHTAGEYQLCGFSGLFEEVPFRNIVDRGYPNYDEDESILPPCGESNSTPNFIKFVNYVVANNGVNAERFTVGTDSQFVLLGATRADYTDFRIFNHVGNGNGWNKNSSGNGYVRTSGAGSENGNSCGFHLQYGAFDFITAGDLVSTAQNYQALYVRDFIGQGKLEAFKSNHHMNTNSWGSGMQNYGFEPRVIVIPSFSTKHADPDIMGYLWEQTWAKDIYITKNWDSTMEEYSDRYLNRAYYDGHVVIRVKPGGGSFRVYMLDNTDEEYTIKYASPVYICN